MTGCADRRTGKRRSGQQDACNGSRDPVPLPPPLCKIPLSSVVTTTDESDDNEAAQQVRLGDRYCSDCEIQFKSFKTFKVRKLRHSNIDRPATRPRRVLSE